MKSHAKHMIIAVAVILVALMAFGVSWRQAAPYALLLACPLMMVFMMSGGHGHGGHGDAGARAKGGAGREQIGPDREQIEDPSGSAAPHDHGSH